MRPRLSGVTKSPALGWSMAPKLEQGGKLIPTSRLQEAHTRQAQPVFTATLRRIYPSKHLFHVSASSPTNPSPQDNSRTSHGYHCRACLVQLYRLFTEAQQTCSRSMWIPSHNSKASMRLLPLTLLSLAIWLVGDQRSRIIKPLDRPVSDQIFSSFFRTIFLQHPAHTTILLLPFSQLPQHTRTSSSRRSTHLTSHPYYLLELDLTSQHLYLTSLHIRHSRRSTLVPSPTPSRISAFLRRPSQHVFLPEHRQHPCLR